MSRSVDDDAEIAQVLGKALNLIGKRITAEQGPLENAGGYEREVRRQRSIEHGAELREMAQSGMTAEQIVEAHLAAEPNPLDRFLHPREPRPEGPEPKPSALYESRDAERRANAEMIRAQDAGREANLASLRAVRAQLRANDKNRADHAIS